MKYWLSRDGQSAPEGPYILDQLENMFDSGELTIDATICKDGSDEWEYIQPVIAKRQYLRDKKANKKPMGFTKGCAVFFIIFMAIGVVGSLTAPFREGYVSQGQKAADARAEYEKYAVHPSWDGSVQMVEKFVKGAVRDPSSVKFNNWENHTFGDTLKTTVDFTASNGFGGPVRERWSFALDRRVGLIKSVDNLTTGETLYNR